MLFRLYAFRLRPSQHIPKTIKICTVYVGHKQCRGCLFEIKYSDARVLETPLPLCGPTPCAVCLGRSDGADVMALPSPPKHPTHTHSAREPRCWHWDPCAHRLCTPAIDYCHPLARTYTLRQTRSVRNVRECVYVWVCVCASEPIKPPLKPCANVSFTILHTHTPNSTDAKRDEHTSRCPIVRRHQRHPRTHTHRHIQCVHAHN